MTIASKIYEFVADEWHWILVYIMIGVVMYWTSIVIQPTFDILRGQQERAIQIINNQNNNTALLSAALKQNQVIIEAGTNNTALLVEMFERQNKLLGNQVILVTKLANATSTLQGDQILGNLSVIEKKIQVLQDEIANLKQSPAAAPTALSLFIPAYAVEDTVGEILEDENISRNPPETANASGQISSFTEGPVVVTNSTINVIDNP